MAMLAKKLETELKCGLCKDFFKSPRILNCGHSICNQCGTEKIEKITTNKKSIVSSNSSSNISTFQQRKGQSVVSAVTSTESEQDAISESDSGIFLSHASYCSLGSENAFASSMTQPGATLKLSNKHDNCQFQLQCPVCHCSSGLPQGASSIEFFPSNSTLESIVDRYQQQNGVTTASSSYLEAKDLCQLCDDVSPNAAVLMCEQCEVLYCNPCREKCHPMRGPLEKHSLIGLGDRGSIVRRKSQFCTSHSAEKLEYFCEECNQLICQQCVSGNHFRHPMIPMATHVKNSKVALSKSLQRISEKVISGTEFIQSLKGKIGQFKDEYDNFIKGVDLTFDEVIEMVEMKRKQSHEEARQELVKKEKIVRDQMLEGSLKISQTTSMIHLAVELIKESNLSDFSMISDQTLKRANKVEKNLLQELNDLRPKCNKRMELQLDTKELFKEINDLRFKSFKCPESPKFIMDRCSVWDNLINVVWHPQGSIEVDRYLLEIDDGVGGQFKNAYCGPESMCTIENLHFGANYRLRIKAINEAGVSHCGDIIRLTTSSIDNFRMVQCSVANKCGVSLSSSGMTIESPSTNNENVVFLASTGFCKGVHYWEYTIDYYDGIGQPSFGVATENCAKNKRLGSDVFSWGMYMNSKRSWFQHNSEHKDRTDIQLHQGTKIGIRLDLDQQKLSYFVNNQPHGPIAYSQLLVTSSRSYNQLMKTPQTTSGSSHSLHDCSSRSKMLYPAVSVTNGIRINLRSGLPPPTDDSGSEEEADVDQTSEIMTPSLTKRIDITSLLEDLSGSNDCSFRDLTL